MGHYLGYEAMAIEQTEAKWSALIFLNREFGISAVQRKKKEKHPLFSFTDVLLLLLIVRFYSYLII